MITLKGKYTDVKIMLNSVEPSVLSQITLAINHPAFTNPIVLQPDTHVGKGSVVGFCMKASDKIIANTIGVDIGCGMLTALFDMPSLSLEAIDKKIRKVIPMGQRVNEKALVRISDCNYDWEYVNKQISKITKLQYPYDYRSFGEMCKRVGAKSNYVEQSLGSLGGGNHFIEIGKDSKENYYIILHSGSRNLGVKICEYWMGVAYKRVRKEKNAEYQQKLEDIKKNFSKREIEEKIKELKNEREWTPSGMEYVEGEDRIGYLKDMIVSQEYASYNRELILNSIMDELKIKCWDIFHTTHNYVDFSDMIIRKGAIKSEIGRKMVIPLNMRDGILLCEGKSNPDWLNSAPHGAGRVLSRSKAKETLSVNQFKTDMEGVYNSNIGAGLIDEAPRAYKDSEMIIKAIEPTAKIIDKIKPIINLKA